MILDPEVSDRYGTALFHVAQRGGKEDVLMEQLQILDDLVKKGSQIRTFLEAPHFSTQDQERVMENVFRGRVDDMIITLLHLLIRRRRIFFLEEIIKRFVRLVEEGRGIFSADVISAVDIDSDQQRELEACLEKYTGDNLRTQYRKDPRLLGGLIFRYRDLLIDDSIRRRLNEIRGKMLAAKL